MVSNISTASSFMVTVAAALLLLLSPQGEAFSLTSSCRSSLLTTARCSTPRFGRITQLQMSADDEDEEPVGLPPLPSDAAVKKVVAEQQTSSPQKAVVSNNASSSSAVEDEATSYPIDLPSPILLATSMVLAISSIGKKRDVSFYIFGSNLLPFCARLFSDYGKTCSIASCSLSKQQQTYKKYDNTNETKTRSNNSYYSHIKHQNKQRITL
jgi:hypothetical protein